MTLRKVFILDLDKCTGCHACEVACRIANEVPEERRWRRVRTFNELHVHGVEVAHLSLACNHCAAAPCMEACPARAFYRDEAAGAVLINNEKCIGCGYCAWTCPYGAPQFDEKRGVMTKCDFCAERQRAGRAPACVTACPTGALDWAELPAEKIGGTAPGMADAGADPSICLIPLEPGRTAPRQTEPPAMPPWRALADRIAPGISLRREWALVAFTMLVALLVGLLLASRLGAPAPHPGAFLGTGVAGLLLSASHLGRRARAWRAALHADSSWLSREIVLFTAFLCTASLALLEGHVPAHARDAITIDTLSWPGTGYTVCWKVLGHTVSRAALGQTLGLLAAVLGLACLFATDRVYRTATIRGAGPVHSAHVLGAGFLLAAAWSGAAAVVIALAALKAALYTTRKWNRLKLGLPARWGAITFRLGLLGSGVGLAWSGASGGAFGGGSSWWGASVDALGEVAAPWYAAPAAAGDVAAYCWSASSATLGGGASWPGLYAIAFVLLAAAELIDRAEYYDELEITTPESLMGEELARRPEAAQSPAQT